jgi:hypothetical protein
MRSRQIGGVSRETINVITNTERNAASTRTEIESASTFPANKQPTPVQIFCGLTYGIKVERIDREVKVQRQRRRHQGHQGSGEPADGLW